MEENCKCEEFNGKEDYFYKFLKNFNIIAASNLKKSEQEDKVCYTSILKCRKCNSYYIWDSYTDEYDEEDKVSARKYNPQVKEDDLRKILNNLEGIISEENINEQLEWLNKLKEEKIDPIYKLHDSHN
ncbi:MAG: hypothetical protein ACP5NZ_04510 [Nanobdellota archaeon]